ncbi:MAG: lipase/esterase [Amycolatopsis sp.]|jgi:acetyl esterase/lipase|uniref:alpha/beta hydrolase n=1 Tax=Amycolatopsis sp. TaxID=37632 RepID=UPI002604A36B|nr:alpha/beta hydrolase [Amycolatopsis sp.]MCU1687319.1 lipase/esterase [Amycolatopsis sp.]
MGYRFDPELAPWVDMLPKGDLTDLAAVRSGMGGLRAQMPAIDLPENLEIQDVVIPGSPDVRVRVYTPTGLTGPLPAQVYIHGGGFILGDIEMVSDGLAKTAADVGAVIVSVDYRLAPETPFPGGLEDCYTALKWTVDNAAELNIDTARVAIGGESAGGGLSAGLALLARDRGGPAIAFQFLGVPELDDRLETTSMQEFTDTPLWNRPNAVLSWKYYLSGGSIVDGKEGIHYAAPARAEDLKGLPSAYITTCEFDPLRDEGLNYAQRLLQAGVSVEIHHYPGTFHGSGLVAEAAVSKRMAADHLDALRRAFARD